MTEFEAVGVLEKASHPPSEKSPARGTIPAQTGSGKRKDEVLGDLSANRERQSKWLLYGVCRSRGDRLLQERIHRACAGHIRAGRHEKYVQQSGVLAVELRGIQVIPAQGIFALSISR